MSRALAAALIVAAALSAGCGAAGGGSGGEAATLTIYVSVPLRGEHAAQGRAIEAGARRALAGAGGRSGDFKLRAVYLDDSRGGGWDIVRTAANARRAAEDVSAIGYIGELDPAATRISLPITNQAEIAQIFPAAAGSKAAVSARGGGDPERLQPSGKNTFVALAGPKESDAAGRGSQAMRILIMAIERAGPGGADRGAVLDELLGP